MVQFDKQYLILIGYDRTSRRNRYRIFDLVAQTWQPEGKDGRFPKGGAIPSQLFCDAFKADGRTTIFLSGHGYNTFLYDVESEIWRTGKFTKRSKNHFDFYNLGLHYEINCLSCIL